MDLNFRPITLADMEAMAVSNEAFLSSSQLTASDGALLPEEFMAQILPAFAQHPDWLGFFALSGSEIVGSGMFKYQPVDGATEIGYGIAPSAEGKGVATALAGALVDFAFANGVQQVIAHTMPDGVASQRVLLKNGFVFTGTTVDPEDGLVNRYVLSKETS